MTIKSVTGTFSATGQSSTLNLQNEFNLSMNGFGSATVILQRSFDNGSNWFDVKSYTSNVSESGFEPEDGVLYRFNCSSYTSGTVNYRLSK